MRLQESIRICVWLLLAISLATRVSASDDEVTSVIAEVVIATGSINTDQKARKELEALAKQLAKLPKKKMIEIEGAYPLKKSAVDVTSQAEINEEYFNKSFILAMEAEGYIRETLRVNQDFYLSARNRSDVKSANPLIRIVLHTGTFTPKPISSVTQPASPTEKQQLTVPIADRASSGAPQVTPIPFGTENQNLGYQQQVPVVESSAIDERMVAEQAKRAQDLIEKTKAQAAERERLRKLAEEKGNAGNTALGKDEKVK